MRRMYYGKLNRDEDKCKIPHDFPDTPCKKCNEYYTIDMRILKWILWIVVVGLLVTLFII